MSPAPGICGTPGCGRARPCPYHRPPAKGWDRVPKRALPRRWRRLRAEVMARDAYRCTRCGAPASDVDHLGHRDDHSLANLAALCARCHRAKTAAQALAARRAAH